MRCFKALSTYSNTRYASALVIVSVGVAAVSVAPSAWAMPGANQYEFERTGVNAPAIPGMSTIDSIFSSFDQATNQFVWEATFSTNPTSGGGSPDFSALPTGFTLVVNDGPMPKGHLGELAVLYFEAEEFFNSGLTTGEASLSAYAYNGASSASAHRTSDGRDVQSQTPAPPDQIVSSRNVGQLSSLVVTLNQDDSGSQATRSMRIEFDASEINNHNPDQPSVAFDPDNPDSTTPLPEGWFGIGFAQEIGIWFHPFNNINPEYIESGDEAGFLEHGVAGPTVNDGWQVLRANYGFFDEENLDAELVPEPASAMLLLAGVSLMAVRRRRA